jgi:hypothetical protein
MLSIDQATQALNELTRQPAVNFGEVNAIVDQVNSASSTPNGVLYSGSITRADGSLQQA